MSKSLKILNLILIITVIFTENNLKAQEINAKLDSFQIEIGTQVYFHFSVKQEDNQYVEFPILLDTIINGIEIIEKTSIDTISKKNGKVHLRQSFLITSFEDSLYKIPEFPFITDNDTLYTKSLMFDVQKMKGVDSTFVSSIDTTQKFKVFDIKKPVNTPLTFKEFIQIYYHYIIAILIFIVIAFLSWYFIKRWRENKPLIEIKKYKEPAHLIAFRELENLKEKKLWQTGKEKQYYSELTDIIREYIYNRYNIQTFEKTSYQLLENIKHSKVVDNERFADLSVILNLADLAKFAKYKPLANENDLSLKNAITFVEKTLVEEKKENIKKENIDIAQKKKK